MGGGTAFPKVGVVAFPVKGSVVFWRSLKDDGKIDRKSLHGGCPTVHGIKWGKNRITHTHVLRVIDVHLVCFTEWGGAAYRS